MMRIIALTTMARQGDDSHTVYLNADLIADLIVSGKYSVVTTTSKIYWVTETPFDIFYQIAEADPSRDVAWPGISAGALNSARAALPVERREPDVPIFPVDPEGGPADLPY